MLADLDFLVTLDKKMTFGLLAVILNDLRIGVLSRQEYERYRLFSFYCCSTNSFVDVHGPRRPFASDKLPSLDLLNLQQRPKKR